MTPFLQFVENIDGDKPDFIAELRREYNARPTVRTIEDLDEEERTLFNRRRTKYRRALRNNWQGILAKNINYKSPAILNLDVADLEKPHRLYVLPVFIRSGRHDILFSGEDSAL
jgi:hypothetical protein